MKLVEILALDMKAWPLNARYAEQDYDKEVRFVGHESADYFASELADKCRDNSLADGILFSQRVTREQWQAAVDALKTPTWTGGGPPPVGAVCEVSVCDTAWRKVTIVAFGKEYALVKEDKVPEEPFRLELLQFRPIRSAEQIAAEEKSKAVSEIIKIIGWTHSIEADYAASRLYEAGYRKQAAP